MLNLPIYMDNNATTRMDPRVFAALTPYFCELYGNAASRSHPFGWAAEKAVEKARQQVASILGAADPKEIIWTSGATESNNLAIKGVAEMYADKGKHIITCTIEHKAVLDPCKRLEQAGYEITWLKPDATGRVQVADIAAAIRPDTILVSIMYANNEIGTINPIREIGALCHSKGVLFHTDATQAVGKIPVDVQADQIDLLSFTAHKIYGPKGCGALYVRKKNPRVRLTPIIDGGGHERGMRSGTLNVTGIVGLGAACEICQQEMAAETAHVSALRDRLEQGLMKQIDHVVINGNPAHRLPQMTNLSFEYVEGESLLMGIDDIAVSSGSACTSASLEPSYVLKNLGVGDELAHSSIRFGLSRYSTAEEVDYTIAKLTKVVSHLREMSPLYELAKEGIDLASVQWNHH